MSASQRGTTDVDVALPCATRLHQCTNAGKTLQKSQLVPQSGTPGTPWLEETRSACRFRISRSDLIPLGTRNPETSWPRRAQKCHRNFRLLFTSSSCSQVPRPHWAIVTEPHPIPAPYVANLCVDLAAGCQSTIRTMPKTKPTKKS